VKTPLITKCYFYPSPNPSHRGRGIFKGFDPLPKRYNKGEKK
jgi:hypothetical protein